jgi:hypothetical protein
MFNIRISRGIIALFFGIAASGFCQDRAEQVMKAHVIAYPGVITRAEYRDGDWAVLLRGKWFYYADGRFLPEGEREKAESWARQSFYGYPEELPPWKEPEGEQAERLGNVLKNRRANPPQRNPEFYDTLWQAHTRAESEANLVRITFLGKRFPVHRELEGRLKKIDALIQEAAKTDPEVKAFIDNIGSIGAWNWRNVAATVSRSFHSYATALDIQPKNIRGLSTYWQWAGSEWYKVPYTKRYHPPLAIVKIFERYGFCWGGKWPLFDTIHFEYRPEIMILSGMTVEN